MTTMNKSLLDLLHCQHQTQNDMTLALQAVQQSQRDYANTSLVADIPTFDGKPKLYFIWA